MINKDTLQFTDNTGIDSPNYTLPQYQVAIDDSISVDCLPAGSEQEIDEIISKNKTNFLKKKIGVYKLVDVIEIEDGTVADIHQSTYNDIPHNTSYNNSTPADYTYRAQDCYSASATVIDARQFTSGQDIITPAWAAVPAFSGFCGSTAMATAPSEIDRETLSR